MTTAVKQRLLTEIEYLSESQLTEVLRFMGNLQANAQPNTPPGDPTPDPLSSFTGAVSHGSLAQEVDPTSMVTKLFVDTWDWLTLHDRREDQHAAVVEQY